MKCTIGASIFGVIAILWLLIGAYTYRKTERKQAGMTWIALILIMLGCYHTFAAVVINLLHLPVNIISIGILDIVAGAFFWWRIYKTKEKQEYEFVWIDLAFVVTILIAVGLYAKIKYGGMALNINYLTIDPASHFRAAMDFVNTQSITSMFYENVWNGLLIELLGPFASVDYYYRWFVLGEVINLALSALAFYGITRRYCKDTYTKLAAYFLSLMYLIGYPMCSAQYGFVYLGMCVTIIGMLIIVTDMYIKEDMGKWLNIVFLMLGCLAVFECYVMFMPVVFFAIISCVFLKQWKRKVLVSKDTVLICLAIFLLPCIIGFAYTYAGIFQQGVTVSSAIANEGACYRELYSNFVPYIPLMLLGYIAFARRRENHLLLFLAPYSFVFTFVLFLKAVKGQTSTYYYYKMYYLLWLLVFVLAFYGVLYAQKQTRFLIVGCFLVWCMLTGIYLGDIEEKIQYHNPLLAPTARADDYNDILNFNHDALGMPGYSKEKEELYHYVYTQLLSQGETLVPMAGYWEDDLWYQAITNQRYYGWGQSEADHTDYFNHLNESDASYILVLKDSQIYEDEQEYFDSLEKIYDTEIGFVGKLD